VRGSSWDDADVVDDVGDALVDAGALVAAGAVVAAGVVDVGAVAAFFFVCFGADGAVSGSWYCWSPAPPSANAAAGGSARSSTTTIDVRTLLGIAALVADAPRDAMVTLPSWASGAG
jgi:hypothetical protein